MQEAMIRCHSNSVSLLIPSYYLSRRTSCAVVGIPCLRFNFESNLRTQAAGCPALGLCDEKDRRRFHGDHSDHSDHSGSSCASLICGRDGEGHLPPVKVDPGSPKTLWMTGFKVLQNCRIHTRYRQAG